jgi:hypothetical protein
MIFFIRCLLWFDLQFSRLPVTIPTLCGEEVKDAPPLPSSRNQVESKEQKANTLTITSFAPGICCMHLRRALLVES